MGILERLRRLLTPAVFEIRLETGHAEVLRGRVSRTFFEDCHEISCDMPAGDRIHVRGVRDAGGGIRLTFAGTADGAVRQRLRNAWGFR